MSHVYILRYIAKDNPTLPVMNIQDNPDLQHIPFPPTSQNLVDYSISRMEHIWNGLFKIHSNIQSMLSRWSEKQGQHPRCSKVIYFNAPHVFNYILNLCNLHDVAQPRNSFVKKSYILLTSGMKRYRQYGKKLHCTTLHFETKEQLNMLSQLVIGVSGRFGLRRRPPTLKDVHGQLLEPHYSLNYVLGSVAVETPYCQRTTKDGIDLTYISSGHLRISVRSRRFLYSADGNGIPKSCNCPVMMDMILFFPEKFADAEDLSSTNESSNSSNKDDDVSVISAEDPPSEESTLQPDTYFRHPQTQAVFKITNVNDKDVL